MCLNCWFPFRWSAALALLAGLALSAPAALIFNSGDTTKTENFNGLGTSGTTFPVAGVPFVGWDNDRTDASTTTMTSDNGASTAGGIRNLGVAGAGLVTDRALGTRGANNSTPAIGLNIRNSTGGTIGSFTISYRRELWRSGSSSSTEVWNFQYAIVASEISVDNSAATWINFDALDMSELRPTLTSNTAIDGNASGNFATVSATFNVPLANNQYLALRWLDANSTGQDAIMAVDDFTITAVPEPVNVALGIFAATAALIVAIRRRKVRRAIRQSLLWS